MTEAVPTSKPMRSLDLSKSEFVELTDLIRSRAGLYFSLEKRREFQQKLSNKLSLINDSTGRDIVNLAKEFDDALQEIINCVTIGESYFNRNQPHFDALKEHIIPQLIEQNSNAKCLKIWCAGCAKGEEPYSLSILLREHFPVLANWNVRITATDINTDFLKKAKQGAYTKWSFRQVEERLIDKYFIKEGENRYQLCDEIRKTVLFEWLNLADFPYRGRLPEEEYDLVVCRNVLIYFIFEFANKVIDAIGEVTHPGSFLLVGHSEAFPALSRLDVIYSNATYYYRYHTIPGEQADKHSIAPGPRYSIPGIGVKTAVPSAPYKTAEDADGADKGREAPKDIGAELDDARKLMNHGKASEAFDLLTKLSKGRGELDFRLHFLRSIVADQMGETNEALKSLKQAIFLNKYLIIAHFFQGVVNQRENRNKIAKKSFRNAYNLVSKLDPYHLLEETDGLSAGRLKEILEARLKEIQLEERSA
jgi:chemotaxis protein methyltransferase CheR